jgi:hypothetical protein
MIELVKTNLYELNNSYELQRPRTSREFQPVTFKKTTQMPTGAPKRKDILSKEEKQ